MALIILTLAEMKAQSSLGEVQALTEDTLAPLEATGIDLLKVVVERVGREVRVADLLDHEV